MRTSEVTRRRVVASAAVLVLLAATTTALMQRLGSSGQSVPICIKDNGQLRLLTGDQCEPSERQTDWTVGGEVTDVRLGQGIVGSREDGTINLSLDPSIVQNIMNDRVYAGHGGSGIIQNVHLLDLGDGYPQVAKLDLPFGAFAVFAKLVVVNSGHERAYGVSCILEAGDDSDASSISLPQNSNHTVSLQMAHNFTQPGSVILRCVAPSLNPAQDTTIQYGSLKITAIGASGITVADLDEN